jgi:hypothetical protein
VRRFTNVALGVALGTAFATGVVAQAAGTSWGRVVVVAHGASALALVALAPWKTAALVRSRAGHRRRARLAGAALVGAAAVTIGSGLAQASGLVSRLGPATTMQVHVGGAILTVGLALVHVLARREALPAPDEGRRTFLRSGALALGAAALWSGWEAAVAVAGWPGARRRFTGSHERGSGSPEGMPVAQWLDDRVLRIDAAGYRLATPAGDMTLRDLEGLPLDDLEATLDCTSGWYSTQSWQGVRLDRLITPGEARSVRVISTTGYRRRFPIGDLPHLWLATRLGGAPLSPGHGFPVRLVAPGRRGYWWVKWVERIELSALPSWLQLPFPLS